MARILGLDIGRGALRGVVVRTSMRSSEIEQFLEVPLSVATDPQGRAEAFAAALAELTASLPRPADEVVVALDGREGSLRVVELPAGAAKRIAEVLPFELNDVLPFEVEEAVVDHQPVDKTDTLLRVLAAAAPRARVETLLAELKSCGLDPKEVSMGAASLDGLRHLIPELNAPGPLLVASIGVDRTDVCVLEKGACTFARTTDGGVDLLSSGRQVQLGGSLKRTLAAYRAAGHPPPSRVYLGGDGALYAESMLPWLQETLGVEASLVAIPDRRDPNAKTKKAPPTPEEVALAVPMATASPERAAFAFAAALAARGAARGKRVDLRQGPLAYTKAMSSIRGQAKRIAIAAAPVLVAFLFATWARHAVLAEEREMLQTQLAEVTKDVFDEETRDPAAARDLLEGGRRIADPLPKFTAWDALDAVSAAIPAEIQHDTRRLSIEVDDESREGRLELQGLVASLAERDTIAANFEAHPCFDEIKPGPTSPGPNNTGLNYRLEATLHCPGDEPIVAPDDRRSRRNNRSRN
ncbi:MAG: pilus assembly protein PilM [Sandaracinus sp.]|nr:pilus assembly protein PilM [Sandaracinus sp.]MCB9611329.1 pilus assembly protein PilM [Sandaracinus sp.]MCB9621831.1 pilus assembly protein PilM [Sandaracinus sp.]